MSTRYQFLMEEQREDAVAGRSRWIIDPTTTGVDFSVRMAKVATVEGRFDRVEGTIVFDDVPQRSRVDLRIDAASIDTRNFVRDFHLRTADYLDVKRFPTITFVSTDVAAVDAATYRVTGDLTIQNTTRAISLDVTCDEETTDEGGRRRSFAAEAQIYRKAFGVDPGVAGFGFLIGDKVAVRVRAEAVEKRESGMKEEAYAAHQ